MEKPKQSKWFYRIVIPLFTVAFFAAATLLFRLPALRMRAAQSAFDRGEYTRTVSLLRADDSVEATELVDRARFALAKAAADAGDDAAAEEQLAGLPETDDVKALKKELRYRAAVRLWEAEEYESALEAFRALDGYRDSFARETEVRCALAERIADSGDVRGAIEAFLLIGSEQSQRRAGELAIGLTGIADAEQALRAVRGIAEEPTPVQEQTARIRNAAALPRLAVGFFHTLGLCADGSAVAVGSNAYGQCDVQDWQDLIAVAAGAMHSVGLRADGTVVAAGDDRYGQCRVKDWTGVVEIAAGYYDTVALTESGQILYAGFHDFRDTQNWPQDLTAIAAGGYTMGALRKNGSLLAASASAKAPDWTGLVSIAVHNGYSIGLQADGTPVGRGVTLPDWHDIAAIAAGATRVLALDSDGTVLEYAFDPRDRILPETPITGALAAANGATHAAILLSDGTVVCFGSDTYGECRTESWRLKTE